MVVGIVRGRVVGRDPLFLHACVFILDTSSPAAALPIPKDVPPQVGQDGTANRSLKPLSRHPPAVRLDPASAGPCRSSHQPDKCPMPTVSDSYSKALALRQSSTSMRFPT